jgi:predicted metal-dependent phosphoesterase TrpH
MSVDEALHRCAAHRLDGIAITDHDSLDSVAKALVNKGNLIVVPGVEISARDGHILALNASELVPAGLTIAETVDRIRGQGALAVLAHPYSVFKTWVNSHEVEEAKLSAVEVANAAQFPYRWMLRKNSELAERLALPKTGGSDAHIPETIGRAYTIIEADSFEVDDVIRAIEQGRTEPGGSGITLSERLKKLF